MSELSEALLGVTGVIRPKPDATTVARADELLEEWRERCYRWVAAAPKAWSPPSAQGYGKPDGIREALMHTPQEPEGVHDLGDDVLAAEWVLELEDAREQLLAAWPAVVLRGGGWEEEAPLSFDRAQDWLGLVSVIEDPKRLLFELESQAVVPAQLVLFESVNPGLYGVLVEETFKAVVDQQVKKRELTPAKERVVRLVLKS